jgi:serine/threonine protein kinase
MSGLAPIFRGQRADYVAKELWRESRLTRVLCCLAPATGEDVVVKVSRRRTVFDRAESAFHDGFTDFFGSGAAHCLVEHEAFALQALDDPRIVPLLDYGSFDDRRFIVTRRVRGQMLRAYTKSPWPASSAKRLAIELLRALEHLRQRRTVHRDLRPENIMVCDPAAPSLTLIDLELAAVDGSPHDYASRLQQRCSCRRRRKPGLSTTPWRGRPRPPSSSRCSSPARRGSPTHSSARSEPGMGHGVMRSRRSNASCRPGEHHESRHREGA